MCAAVQAELVRGAQLLQLQPGQRMELGSLALVLDGWLQQVG